MTPLLTTRPGAWLPLLFAALLAVAGPSAYGQDDMADADPALPVAEADAEVVVDTAVEPTEEEDPPIVATIEDVDAQLGYTLNNLLLFICAVLVLFMQAGFAMVVAGFCPSKHTVNILFKNALDLAVGVCLYFLVGYHLMYPAGEPIADGYLGEINPGIHEWDGSLGAGAYHPQVDFFFQVAFAATAATIVAGAVAGRMKFGAYLVYSAVLTGLVYPISGYWKWGGGFLDALGFYDFAGCGVVHMVGGFAALAGAIVLGPRLGRYTPDGKPVASPGHSLPLATLGTFILLIGWFGFNPGSQLAIYGEANATAVVTIAVNTLLAASSGAVMATLLSWGLFGKPDLSMGLNGMLGGLVGITANCDGVSNVSALIIGAVAGALIVASIIAMDKVRIDDPVGAFPVHGVCGMWGLLAIPLFWESLDDAGNPVTSDAGEQYGTWVAQLSGLAAYAAWAFVTMFALFFLLKMIGFLRVSAEDEERGLDISEHGMTAYST
ncbi:ammonium transporter [Alienimonas californiensis]|uniref:Ammonium transporter n=1 Tax=Alienimonas californiensis TaxID=2527989 RepID=A0A517PAW2_9PLAN|nr:ammonium transporter [Alienimonas californiensis]QDT16509.1 Ammonia channel precursor [Alienimonas californiensis]